MPLFPYVCTKCEHEFEALVRGQEQPECPECGGRKLERRLSLPIAHANGRREAAPMSEGNCGLPQCGMGRCGMQ